MAERATETAPRCGLCGTELWWMGSHEGWRHGTELDEVDPVALAKRYIPREFETRPKVVRDLERRRWLRSDPILPYDSQREAVQVWVLEGSPPQGFVLAWRDRAVRLGSDGEKLLDVNRWMIPAESCPGSGREVLWIVSQGVSVAT